jgi:hypothetical protein
MGMETAGAGPHSGVEAYYRWYDVALASLSTAHMGSVTSAGLSNFNLTPPTGARYFDVSVESGGVAITDLAFVSGEVDCGGGSDGFCVYGTRPKPDTTGGIIVTTGLVDLLLVAAGVGPWAAIVFDTFVGKVVYGGDLCAGLPPPMPVFTNDDYTGGVPNVIDPVSRAKWWAGLQAVAWPYFCECVPGPGGSPPFVPPPPPRPAEPPAAPPAPTIIECDGLDICTVLNALARQLSAISGRIASMETLVTLIQRQGVPFGYVTGAVHPGLTGNGSFDVADILGLVVDCTTIPPYLGADFGTPDEHLFLGRLNLGTLDGWQPRFVLVDQPQLMLAVSGAITVVGYSLAGGVVATITELRREP